MLESSTEQGVTDAYRATMEYDPTRGGTVEWSEEFPTPLQAALALTWQVGHLTGNGTLPFDEGFATVAARGDGPDTTAARWSEFARIAAYGGNGEIILHGKRWVIKRDQRKCVKRGDECTGTVDYHESLAGTGTSNPWCEGHWEEICRTHERYREYDSDTPPDWFDPTYAGESWDED